MSSTSKAWLVAASIGAVEASKDQLGMCRWNYLIRSVSQRIRNNVRSASQANRFSSSTVASVKDDDDKARQAEESVRTVMYLLDGYVHVRPILEDYILFTAGTERRIISSRNHGLP